MKNFYKKQYEKIQRDKKALSESYGVAESAVVYIGDNKYIVVKDGREIRI